MKRFLGVLLGLGFVAGAPQVRADDLAPAQRAGPDFSHGNWNVTCDGLGGCSTWGLGETWGSPGYIVVAGTDGRLTLTLGAYDTNSTRAWRASMVFTLEVVDSQGRTLWFKAFPGRDERKMWLRAQITNPAEADRAVQALAVGHAARLRVDGQSEPAAVVSLSGSAAALLWARSHGQADPARPAIRRAPPLSQAHLPRSRLVRTPSGEETACLTVDQERVDRARLAPGKVLWITTCDIGYNKDSTLRLTDERGRLLETPPIETGQGEGQNFIYDAETRTLTSTFYANSTRSCGDTSSWIWDGAQFRFASHARMDDCQGMAQTDWPATYRARIVDR